ncbi:hypothetical protein D0Z00_001027 [Geotrichum galactomycetum]|uniref:Uncharacterized protein n=1 Tax=Geotrichum galactomycetum TaxID=27317 RepID=A0ACB6V8F6_9ASCO|nr:hypothetical protein D0Z00_001027 [Geotrichum candidum]
MKNLFVLAAIAAVNLGVNGATINPNSDEKCSQDGDIPFPFPLEGAFPWDNDDKEDEYDDDVDDNYYYDYDEGLLETDDDDDDDDDEFVVRPDLEDEEDDDENYDDVELDFEEEAFIKRYERDAVNYFDSPERYHDTNKQASAALFFSKIFRKKKVTATLTVTEGKIFYANPETVYKTVKHSEFATDISEPYENISIFKPSIEKPSKTYAPFFEDYGKDGIPDYHHGREKFENSIWEPEETNTAKPEKTEKHEEPEKLEKLEELEKPETSEEFEESGEPEEFEESGEPEKPEEFETPEDPKNFFEPEPKETRWPKKTTIFAPDLSDIMPTKVYKTALESEEKEPDEINPSTTFIFEQPETNIVEPVKSKFYEEKSSEPANNFYEDWDDDEEDEFDRIKKEPEFTSLETKTRYSTHFYLSTEAPASTAEPGSIEHSGYETSFVGPNFTDKGSKSIYSHYTTKFSSDNKEKEAIDGTIENQLKNKNHSTSNPSITDAPEPSDVTNHTKYYSSSTFYFSNKSNL